MIENKHNLFRDLEKYPSKKVTPTENFFTSSLTFLINDDPQLGKCIVKLLYPKADLSVPYEAYSQSPYDNHKSIIDIELKQEKKGKTNKIFIEAKIDSKENIDQLPKYLCLAKKLTQENKNVNVKVTYISFSDEIIDNKEITNHPNYLGQFFWEKVYECINDSINKSDKPLTKQFVNFMEMKGMSPLTNITKEESKLWAPQLKLREKIEEILKRIKEELKEYGDWEIKKSSINEIYIQNEVKNDRIFWIGFYGWEKDYEYPNFPEGIYCYIVFKISSKLADKVNLDSYDRMQSGEPGDNLYRYGNTWLCYYEELYKVINFSSTAESQIKELKKFFIKGLKKIEETPEYKKIMKI